MSKPPEHTPLAREKWLLGELSPEAQRTFERQASAEEQAALRDEDAALREELFASLPARVLKARVDDRLARDVRREPRWGWWAAVPMVAVAIASLLLVVRPETPEPEVTPKTQPAAYGERSKGLHPRVVIFRQLAHSAEELSQGASVQAHDLLQLGYVAGGRGFGTLLSIDGRGVVTLHTPRLPNAKPVLKEENGTQLLERAYELDDAPDFERFFFITSERAFDVQQVLSAAESLARDPARAMRAPLVLGPNIEQSSVLLQKQAGSTP